MADFVDIPVDRLQHEVFTALLEEFASRDGTDYGLIETALPGRVAQLRKHLASGKMKLLYDNASETWDLLPADIARSLLDEATD